MTDPSALDGVALPEQRQLALGHDRAREAIRAQLVEGRLPGAIMLQGPQGIGKATFAFELAGQILAATGDEPASRVREQVAALSHPNLSVLRRRPKDAKSFYTVIRVEDVRELREALHHTRGRVGHRIAVLDSIDDCNPSAANALLKTLEEPPPDTTFFLISHRPGQLLPTIRSRCHNLALRPLTDDLVRRIVSESVPGIDSATLERAVRLAGGRPRRAFETLALAEDSPVAALVVWLERPQAMPAAAHLQLADVLGSNALSPEMSFAREILGDWMATEMREAAIAASDRRRLASATELWDKANALLSEADSVNLDMKQTLVVIFDSIRKHLRPVHARRASMTKPFYVTTAISYPNGAPHIGHAYEMIATDAIARWKRLEGREVYFLTGTDEHGIKMVQTAAKEGVPVRELADRNSAEFRRLAAELNLSNDDFIRTTEQRHHEASQAIWRKMEASSNGDIFQSTYKGWYSVRDEAYFDEAELTERDGKRFAPSGAEVEWVEEPTYFFRLSAYAQKLLDLYEANPDFIAPKERRNEIISFVKGGLQDLSISRTTFDWGIPVPGADGHVMYVWVDALTNYITGVGYPDEESELFKKFWPADLHVIGKDIIRFHTVYWPAFLMSAGLPVQHRVFAHGFLTVDGQKMSKSLGNVIDPFELVSTFGADAVRYFFLREVSFGNDGDYGHEKLVNRVNADLANNLGNLAQRSLSMINKNCDGKVPTFGHATPADEQLEKEVGEAIQTAQKAMDEQMIHEATGAIIAALSSANNYFAAQEPWALKKTDPDRMATVLYRTADTVRRLAIPMLAFVPASAARLLDQLAVPEEDRILPLAIVPHRLQPGTELPVPQGVFARLEKPAE